MSARTAINIEHKTLTVTLLLAACLSNGGHILAQGKHDRNKSKSGTEQTSGKKDTTNQHSYLDSLVQAKFPNAAKGVTKNDANRNDNNSGKITEVVMCDKKDLPAKLWYGTRFSSSNVRLCNNTLDSIPDEVKMTLVKNKNTEFCFPVKNVLTSPYGWRERWNRPHRGVDIALKVGDPVRCAFDGVVRIAAFHGGYGNLVVVRHYNGLETVYGHMSKIKVKTYQKVKAGDIIGLGGSTGHSTGPHLHFETRFFYEAFDPEWLLDFKTYTLRTQRLYLDKTYFGITRPRNKKQKMSYKADISIVPERIYPDRSRKPAKEKKYHYTKKGDTWEKLAKKYKISESQLHHLNPEINGKITPDMEIRVK